MSWARSKTLLTMVSKRRTTLEMLALREQIGAVLNEDHPLTRVDAFARLYKSRV
jgi:hypothetical protein